MNVTQFPVSFSTPLAVAKKKAFKEAVVPTQYVMPVSSAVMIQAESEKDRVRRALGWGFRAVA
jgi:hypothetical protein